MWKMYRVSQPIKKPQLSVLTSQSLQMIKLLLKRIVMCVAVCHFLSGLAVLLVELIGKGLIFTDDVTAFC